MVKILCKLCLQSVPAREWNSHVIQKAHLQQLPSKIVVKGPFKQDEVHKVFEYFGKFGGIRGQTVTNEGDQVCIEYRFWNAKVYSEIIHQEHSLFDNEVEISWYKKDKSGALQHVLPDERMRKEKFVYRKLAIIDSLKELSTFDEQLALFLNKMSTIKTEMDTNKKIIYDDLTTIVVSNFPQSMIHFFGSCVTGLDIHDSDLNLYVDNTDSEMATLELLKDQIEKSQSFLRISLHTESETQVIKCEHKRGKVFCEINIKNELPVGTSELIKFYLMLDEKLKPLMVLVKFWIDCCELRRENGLSSYAVYLMVLFYLQQSPYDVPCVVDLQKDLPADEVDGWNCTFGPIEFKSPSLEKATVFDLLSGFLKFYSCFDYTAKVISPFYGAPIDKIRFLKPCDLPDCFEDYVNRDKKFVVNSGICIQDVFDHSNNVSLTTDLSCIGRFTAACRKSLELVHLDTKDLLCKLLDLNENLNEFTLSNEDFCDEHLIKNLVLTILTKICNCDVVERFEDDFIFYNCVGQFDIWSNRVEVLRNLFLQSSIDIGAMNSIDREVAVTSHILKDAPKVAMWKMMVLLKFDPSKATVCFTPEENVPHLLHIQHFVYVNLLEGLKKKVEGCMDEVHLTASTSDQNLLEEIKSNFEENMMTSSTKCAARDLSSSSVHEIRDKVESDRTPKQDSVKTEITCADIVKSLPVDPTVTNIDTTENNKIKDKEHQREEIISKNRSFADREDTKVIKTEKQTENFSVQKDAQDVQCQESHFPVPNDSKNSTLVPELDTVCLGENKNEKSNVEEKQGEDFPPSIKNEETLLDSRKTDDHAEITISPVVETSKKSDGTLHKATIIEETISKESALKEKTEVVPSLQLEEAQNEDIHDEAKHSSFNSNTQNRTSTSGKFLTCKSTYSTLNPDEAHIIAFSPTVGFLIETKDCDSILKGTEEGATFTEQVAIFEKNLDVHRDKIMEKHKLVVDDLRTLLIPVFPEIAFDMYDMTVTDHNMPKTGLMRLYVDGVDVTSTTVDQMERLIYDSIKFSGVSKLGLFDNLIQAEHVSTHMNFELNVKDELPVRTSHLIRSYMSLDHRIFSLLTIIKFWNDLSEDKFTNYSICLMTIFYLQLVYKLAGVSKLQIRDIPKGLDFPNDEVANLKDIDLFELVSGFFRFYDSFDYVTYVISPYFGSLVEKTRLLKPCDLSDCYRQYLDLNVELSVSSSIDIQDPFQLYKNLTADMTPAKLGSFIGRCRLALLSLKNTQSLSFMMTPQRPDLPKITHTIERKIDQDSQKWLQRVKAILERLLKNVMDCTDVTEYKADGVLFAWVCKGERNIFQHRPHAAKRLLLPTNINNIDREVAITRAVNSQFIQSMAPWTLQLEVVLAEDSHAVTLSLKKAPPEPGLEFMQHFLYIHLKKGLDEDLDIKEDSAQDNNCLTTDTLALRLQDITSVATQASTIRTACYANKTKYEQNSNAIEDNLRSALNSSFALKTVLFNFHLLSLETLEIYIEIEAEDLSDVELLIKIHQLLFKSENFANVFSSSETIRCTHIKTEIMCEINISDELSEARSKLLNYYSRLDDNVSLLMYFMKFWADHNKLTGVHGFSSNAIYMMVIFFLQLHFKLPSVEKLQDGAPPNNTDGWNCAFAEQDFKNSELCNSSMKDLVLQFFDFYGKFDYISLVISPYSGEAIDKILFLEPPKLSSSYRRYITNNRTLSVDSSICVQDFFNHSKNMSSAYLYLSGKFATLCRISSQLIVESEENFFEDYIIDQRTSFSVRCDDVSDFQQGIYFTEQIFKKVYACNMTLCERNDTFAKYKCEIMYDVWSNRMKCMKSIAQAHAFSREVAATLEVIKRFRQKSWGLFFVEVKNHSKSIEIRLTMLNDFPLISHMCHFLHVRSFKPSVISAAKFETDTSTQSPHNVSIEVTTPTKNQTSQTSVQVNDSLTTTIQRGQKNHLSFTEQASSFCAEFCTSDVVLKSTKDAVTADLHRYKLIFRFYGSCNLSVHTPNSDVNIQVDSTLPKILQLLRNHANFKDLTRHARCIKCVHIPTNQKLTFTGRYDLSIYTTKLIGCYFRVAEPLRALVVIIKHWAHCCNLTVDISGHMLTLMAIFYLQVSHKLPSVAEIQTSSVIHVRKKWNYVFRENHRMLTNFVLQATIFDLVKGFFRFYGDFDFFTMVVAPYYGFPVAKAQFLRPFTAPVTYHAYRSQDTELEVESGMCIQCPFEHARNVSVSVGYSSATRFAALCRRALRRMQPTLSDLFVPRDAQSAKFLLLQPAEVAISEWLTTVTDLVVSVLSEVLAAKIFDSSTVGCGVTRYKCQGPLVALENRNRTSKKVWWQPRYLDTEIAVTQWILRNSVDNRPWWRMGVQISATEDGPRSAVTVYFSGPLQMTLCHFVYTRLLKVLESGASVARTVPLEESKRKNEDCLPDCEPAPKKTVKESASTSIDSTAKSSVSVEKPTVTDDSHENHTDTQAASDTSVVDNCDGGSNGAKASGTAPDASIDRHLGESSVISSESTPICRQSCNEAKDSVVLVPMANSVSLDNISCQMATESGTSCKQQLSASCQNEETDAVSAQSSNSDKNILKMSLSALPDSSSSDGTSSKSLTVSKNGTKTPLTDEEKEVSVSNAEELTKACVPEDKSVDCTENQKMNLAVDVPLECSQKFSIDESRKTILDDSVSVPHIEAVSSPLVKKLPSEVEVGSLSSIKTKASEDEATIISSNKSEAVGSSSQVEVPAIKSADSNEEELSGPKIAPATVVLSSPNKVRSSDVEENEASSIASSKSAPKPSDSKVAVEAISKVTGLEAPIGTKSILSDTQMLTQVASSKTVPVSSSSPLPAEQVAATPLHVQPSEHKDTVVSPTLSTSTDIGSCEDSVQIAPGATPSAESFSSSIEKVGPSEDKMKAEVLSGIQFPKVITRKLSSLDVPQSATETISTSSTSVTEASVAKGTTIQAVPSSTKSPNPATETISTSSTSVTQASVAKGTTIQAVLSSTKSPYTSFSNQPMMRSVHASIPSTVTVGSAVSTVNLKEAKLAVLEQTKGMKDFAAQVSYFCSNIAMDKTALETNRKIIECDLKYALSFKISCANVSILDSAVTGVWSEGHGFDVYLDGLKVYTSKNQTFKTVVNALIKSFRFNDVTGDTFVKCRHKASNILCYIHIAENNRLPIYRKLLLEYYMSLDPKLRQVFTVIQCWSEFNRLKEIICLSDYTLYVMVIFYLQQAPFHLPPVSELQKNATHNLSGWSVAFVPVPFTSEALKAATVRDLVIGFFTFYSTLDFYSYVIAPYFGAVINKVHFIKPLKVPPCYEYLLKLNPTMSMGFGAWIQDPFEHTRNLVDDATIVHVGYFASLCHAVVELQPTIEKHHLHRLMTLSNEAHPGVEIVQHQKWDGQAWMQTVKNVMFTILRNILCCEVVRVDETTVNADNNITLVSGRKHRSANLQQTVVVCRGKREVWENRVGILKLWQAEVAAGSDCFDVDVFVSNVIMNDPQRVFTFNLTVKMLFKRNPMRVRITAVDGHLLHFNHFFYTRMLKALQRMEAAQQGCHPSRVEAGVSPKDAVCEPFKILVKGKFDGGKISRVHDYFSKFGKIVTTKVLCEEKIFAVEYCFARLGVYLEVIEKNHFLFGHRLKIIPLATLKAKIASINFQDPTLKLIHSVSECPTFEQQVEKLSKKLNSAKEKNEKTYETIRADFTSALCDLFSPCVVSLGSKTADGDTENDFLEVFVDDPSPETDPATLKQTKELISKSDSFCIASVVSEADDSFVTCEHVKMKTTCRLRVRNKLAVSGANLVKYYQSLDGKIAKFMSVLKFWAEYHDLAFSESAIYAMALFYLQHEPYNLPPVKDLQTGAKPELFDGWNCAFAEVPESASPALAATSTLDLMIGFFQFYADFDYVTYVVSPYFGAPIRKHRFLRPFSLPKGFECFRSHRKDLVVHSGVFVQDFFEHCRNVAAVVSLDRMGAFAHLCRTSLQLVDSDETFLLYKLLTNAQRNLFECPDFAIDKSDGLSEDDWIQNVKALATKILSYALNCTVMVKPVLGVEHTSFECRARCNVWDNRVKAMKALEAAKVRGLKREIATTQQASVDLPKTLTWNFFLGMAFSRSPCSVSVVFKRNEERLKLYHICHFLYTRLEKFLRGEEVEDGPDVEEVECESFLLPPGTEEPDTTILASSETGKTTDGETYLAENAVTNKLVDSRNVESNQIVIDLTHDTDTDHQPELTSDSTKETPAENILDNKKEPAVEIAPEETKPEGKVTPNRKRKRSQAEEEEEDDDVPSDFFDDFANEDFLDGLDIVDDWDNQDGLHQESDSETVDKEPQKSIEHHKKTSTSKNDKISKSVNHKERSASKSKSSTGKISKKDDRLTKPSTSESRSEDKRLSRSSDRPKKRLAVDSRRKKDMRDQPFESRRRPESKPRDKETKERPRRRRRSTSSIRSEKEVNSRRKFVVRSENKRIIRRSPSIVNRKRAVIYPSRESISRRYTTKSGTFVTSTTKFRQKTFTRLRSVTPAPHLLKRRKRSRSPKRRPRRRSSSASSGSTSHVTPTKMTVPQNSLLEEIKKKINEVRPVVSPPVYDLPSANIVPPLPHVSPCVPPQSQSPIGTQVYDETFFIGTTFPVQGQYQMAEMVPAPNLPPEPVPPPLALPIPTVFQQPLPRSKRKKKKPSTAQLKKKQKIAYRKYLANGTNMAVPSSTNMKHLQEKVQVLSRCQEVVKFFHERYLIEKPLMKPPQQSSSDYNRQSPLKRSLELTFRFTSPPKEPAKDAYYEALDEILGKVGIVGKIEEDHAVDKVTEALAELKKALSDVVDL